MHCIFEEGKTVKNNATVCKVEKPVLGVQELEQRTMNVDTMDVKEIPFLRNVRSGAKSKTIQSNFGAVTGKISDITARGFILFKPLKLHRYPEGGFTAMQGTLGQEYMKLWTQLEPANMYGS